MIVFTNKLPLIPLGNLTTILLLIFTNIFHSNCDHLQQSSDATESTLNDEATYHHDDYNHQQQLTDPEYIKRELKDVIRMNIDTDKDGSISYEELKNYLAQLHEKNIDFNVDKQWISYSPQIHEVFSWEGYEPERKEVLTWDHYFNNTYPELIGVDVGIPLVREQDTSSILNPTEKPAEDEKKKKKEVDQQESKSDDETEDPHIKVLKLMVRRADARWKLADENGDTLLTKQEFKSLLHPDEGHEASQSLFVTEAVEDIDLNDDKKISLDEFMKHLRVLANDHERDDQSWLSGQQENFGRFLDKNKDGILEGDEIRDWLIPSKTKRHEDEAKRLFDIGDINEDHKLTVSEIIDQFEQYITLLPPEYWSDPSDSNNYHHDIVHDEL